MKTIIVVGLSCAILIALSIGVYQINNKIISNQSDSHTNKLTFAGNNSVNISLNVSLPTESIKLNTYHINTITFDKSFCEKRIKDIFPGWLNDNIEVQQINQNLTCFYKDDDIMSVSRSGGLIYYNGSAEQKWLNYWQSILFPKKDGNTNITYNESGINNSANETNDTSNRSQIPNKLLLINTTISIDVAYNISKTFTQEHGGLPTEYYLSYCHTNNIGFRNFTFPDQYTFHINRKLNGIPILERGGEGAAISITPLGDIIRYKLLWRQISDIDSNVTIVNASRALNYLKQNIQSSGNSTLVIEKIEIGYYSGDFNEQSKKLQPIWIFYYDKESSQFISVDAIGLTFFD